MPISLGNITPGENRHPRPLSSDGSGGRGVDQASPIWAQMLSSLNVAAEMFPFVVANGAQDALIVPSLLSAQGFCLLLARTQMKEVAKALAK